MRCLLVTIAGIFIGTATFDCQATTFDLLNLGINLPSPLSLTVDGITLRLSGSFAFNSSPDAFGIDSNFLTPDDPTLIDISETMFFNFNRPVLLDSIVVSKFDGQDSGYLLLKAANVTVPLVNGTMAIGGIFLGANGSDRVISGMGTATGGTRGFSIDRLIVRAVPEPNSATLILVAVITFIFKSPNPARQ